MKKTILLSILSFLFFCITLKAQTTITVNNNPNTVADYTDLQTALTNAAAGSTILVHGSNTSYGDIDIDKQLKIYGTGYFLAQNYPEMIPAFSSRVGLVRFLTGSQGSVLMGFITNDGNVASGDIQIFDHQIGIYGCRTGYIKLNNVDNSIISNCYLEWAHVYSSTDAIINNNYFNSYPGVTVYSTGSANITNNVFMGRCCNAQNSIIENNITVTDSLINYSSTYNNIVRNNISFTGTYTENNNQSGVNMSTVFVGYPNQNGYSNDGKFQLIQDPTNPAIGAGYGGVDAGMFGGSVPYILSGLPKDIPIIYEMTVPATTSSNSILINVKAKSN